MISALEATAWKKCAAFFEHASNGVEGLAAIILINHPMQVSDHRAIKISQNLISAWAASRVSVFWQRHARRSLHRDKRVIRQADKIQVLARDEVEAITQVDDRADDEWLRDLPASGLPLRPFSSALRIGFPKIGAGPKPIMSRVASEQRNLSVDSLDA